MTTVHALSEIVAATMSVDEYLHSVFETDMDFVDGVLEERNLGEWEHADLQSQIVYIFRSMLPEWHCRAAVECRLQVAPTSFRIPDVMVLHPGQTAAKIIRQAPLVCIEILSPEDRWSRMERKFTDYLRMGVEHVWAIDPFSREAFTINAAGKRAVQDGILSVPGTPIQLDLNAIYSTLDQASLQA